MKQVKNQPNKHSLLRIRKEADPNSDSLRPSTPYFVQEVRELTDTAYILRFDRNELKFRAGQYLRLGLPGDNQMREYSIYSPSTAPYLEVLIQEVDKGMVSKRLHSLKPGELIKVEGPFGKFGLDDEQVENNKYLFIATGTGISPFHSITGSYPDLEYKVLHGVRYANEAYERNDYPNDSYTLCSSRDKLGDFYGRVTDYLSQHKPDSRTLVYLCGNSDMIYEAYDLLTKAGLEAQQIRTEVYF